MQLLLQKKKIATNNRYISMWKTLLIKFIIQESQVFLYNKVIKKGGTNV